MIVGVCSDAVTLCLKQSPRMEGRLKPPRLVQQCYYSPIETAGCQWPIVAGGFPSQSRVFTAGGGSLALLLYHCLIVQYIPQQALALGVSNMILCTRKISMGHNS
jgi:hypothetical protein